MHTWNRYGKGLGGPNHIVSRSDGHAFGFRISFRSQMELAMACAAFPEYDHT